MKKNTVRNVYKIALFVFPLAILPGCGAVDWVKEKLGMSKPQTMMEEMSTSVAEQDMYPDTEKKTRNGMTESVDEAEVLVTLGGKPMVTIKHLEEELEQLIAQYPELKQVLPMMPDAKRNLLMGMLSQIIVDEWVARNLHNKDPEYTNEAKRMSREAQRVVNQKHFSKHHPVEVSDSEVKKFYDKHKDMMPDLMVSRGGVNAVGVKFDDQEDAQAFLAKAKAGNLSDAAAGQGLAARVREFKEVGQHSPGIDQAVREVLMNMSTFPATEMVQVGDDFWVIQGLSKQDQKFKPFEEVQDMIKPAVEQEKRMEHLEGLIDKYKKEFDVEVNEDAVKPDAAAMPQGMPANFGEMMDEESASAPNAA